MEHKEEIVKLLDHERAKRYEIDRDLFNVSAIIAAICFALSVILPSRDFAQQEITFLAVSAGVFTSITAILAAYRLIFEWHRGELKVTQELLSVYTGKKFGRLESKATLLSYYTLLFGIGFPLIALTAILVHRIIFGRI